MISFPPIETNHSLRLLRDVSFEGKGAMAAPGPMDTVATMTFEQTRQIPARTKSSTGEIGTSA
ncbi:MULTISPECIES: hypothetical protein [Alphaproteobacteria]|jgi:hypothetical protein|uniref:hypothetical protein n=1 Tax=Alphaproteobacteria TaxID=28211 RepID=UPI003A8F2B85